MATYIVPRETGLGNLTAAMQPGLQAAMDFYLKKQLLRPEEERAKRKEERDYATGVSKGEIPIQSVPENIRKTFLNPPEKTMPYWMEGLRKPFPNELPETLEAAATRMKSGLAAQQQAMNPYKALQAERLSILKPIYDKYNRGESLNEQEKILIQLKAKESDADPFEQMIAAKIASSMGFNAEPTAPVGSKDTNMQRMIRVRTKTGQTGSIPENEFDPNIYERI